MMMMTKAEQLLEKAAPKAAFRKSRTKTIERLKPLSSVRFINVICKYIFIFVYFFTFLTFLIFIISRYLIEIDLLDLIK